jgi:hypothetical protein
VLLSCAGVDSWEGAEDSWVGTAFWEGGTCWLGVASCEGVTSCEGVDSRADAPDDGVAEEASPEGVDSWVGAAAWGVVDCGACAGGCSAGEELVEVPEPRWEARAR